MFVKVCGITRTDDARLAASLGADAVGFVFWPGSPRAIDACRARAIVEALPAGVMAIGVFVNQPLEDVLSTTATAGLHAVQLHGHEPPAYWEQVSVPVIKAVRLREPFDAAHVARIPSACTLLVDAFDEAAWGGTGRLANWQAAREVAARRRTILAGGLCARNVREAIATVAPYGIDVASGVEAVPGIKDEAKMRAFFEALERK